MDDLMTGLVIGFVAGLVLMSLVAFLLVRRLAYRHGDEIQRYDESIVDLRQERAEDKETNRRLRHELVAKSPDRLVETATNAEYDRDNALSERDQALEQLQLVNQDLAVANNRIADRESKLRQYREALQEIRVSLEAQDRNRGGETAGALQSADGIEVEDALASADELVAEELEPERSMLDTSTDDVPADVLAQVESGDFSSGE